MTYSVVLSELAQAQILDILSNAEDTEAAAIALLALDVELKEDPDRLGESRPGHSRIHFHPPFGVLYNLNARMKVLNILNIWEFESRV